MVNTYLMQLYVPLNFLGTSFRVIRTSIVDLESMFLLLKEDPEIKDEPDAPDMEVHQGEVVFDNVSFGYDGTPSVLHNISFRAPAGKMIAIVGPTGAGKRYGAERESNPYCL